MDGYRPGRVALAGTIGVYLVLSVAVFVQQSLAGSPDWPLKHDQVGYYAYLPALLTPEGLSFRGLDGPRWDRIQASGFAGFPEDEATGRRRNVYPPGVAVLQAPFFVGAHVVAWLTGAARDGLSGPYRLAAGLGGAVYAALGLLLVFAALLLHFPEWAAASVAVALGLGTNLLYYGTVEPLMSHAYSFFAFAALLFSMLRWGRSPSTLDAALVGAALGLAVAIRPTSAVVALLPLLFLVMRARKGDGADSDPAGGPAAPELLVQVGVATAAALLVALPLFLAWAPWGGGAGANPWGGGTFYPLDPAVGSVLWSYRKGWFVYTPLMLLAVPGLFLLRGFVRGITIPLLAFVAANLYVVSSWWAWWYGGSFGMRALIESMVPLSLALAAFVTWAGARRRGRRMVMGALVIFCALNLFQSYQYVMTYIRWDGMTRDSYWAVFLRPVLTAEELAALGPLLDTEPPRLPRGPGQGGER